MGHIFSNIDGPVGYQYFFFPWRQYTDCIEKWICTQSPTSGLFFFNFFINRPLESWQSSSTSFLSVSFFFVGNIHGRRIGWIEKLHSAPLKKVRGWWNEISSIFVRQHRSFGTREREREKFHFCRWDKNSVSPLRCVKIPLPSPGEESCITQNWQQVKGFPHW
jgi:hypothetical protein